MFISWAIYDIVHNNLAKLLIMLRKEWFHILTAIVAVLALLISLRTCVITERLTLAHIKPEIKCKFDLPKDSNPVFHVANVGDIPVMSLSVAHNFYDFDTAIGKISHSAKAAYRFRDDLLFREELGPTEDVYVELLKASAEPMYRHVFIYLFNLRYYSGKDMQKHTREELFFVHGDKVYKHSEYAEETHYKRIMAEIEEVQIPELEFAPGKLKELLKAWDIRNRGEMNPDRE